MPPKHADAIEAFRSSLDGNTAAILHALRTLIAQTDERLEEEFKWNGPSFRLGAEHRITLGVERKGGVRMVLHRGVAKKDTADFVFEDPDRLAVWPAKDRGVISFKTLDDLSARRTSLATLISRWLEVSG